MELLVALIPALPLAGFLFAVFVGPRLDRMPVHGHAAEGHDEHATDASHDAHAPMGDEAALHPVPSEEEQRITSPHAGHDDDLANANGADGVIPSDLNDGLGQAGHVTPGAERPVYRSWMVPIGLVAISWVLSMIAFGSVIFGGGEPLHATAYEWIASGDFRIEVSFVVDPLTAMLLLVVSSVGLLVHVYSIGYMDGDRGFWRFFAYLNLFMFSMYLLVMAENFLLLFVGWELVGLCSYLLIGFWYKK